MIHHTPTKPNNPAVTWNIIQRKEKSEATGKTTVYVGRKYFKNTKIWATWWE